MDGKIRRRAATLGGGSSTGCTAGACSVSIGGSGIAETDGAYPLMDDVFLDEPSLNGANRLDVRVRRREDER